MSAPKVTIRLSKENLERVMTRQDEFRKCGIKVSLNSVANSLIELGHNAPQGKPNPKYRT